VRNQGISAEDGRRIVDSLGHFGYPRLDAALVARQQATIDVISRAGQLPRPVRAADGFDLRFDQVVAEATTGPAAPADTGGPAGDPAPADTGGPAGDPAPAGTAPAPANGGTR
jgi:sulfonate transport system substrate-binding protein